jgi:hypothetical protein
MNKIFKSYEREENNFCDYRESEQLRTEIEKIIFVAFELQY